MKYYHLNLYGILISLIIFSNQTFANQLTPEFKLISNNGLQWGEVVAIPSHIEFSFPRTTYSPSGNTNQTWGNATKITLYKGDCVNSNCSASSNPVLLSRDNLLTENFYIGPLSPNMVFSSTGFFSLNDLKNTCNKKLQNNPDAIYADHHLKENRLLTLHVKGTKTLSGPALGGNSHSEYIDAKRRIIIEANIFCESIGTNPGSIEANELKVFLSTSSNANTQPNAGVNCPTPKFTTRIKTNRAGTLPIYTFKKIGANQIIKKEKQVISTLQADGSFIGRFEEEIPVNKSSVIRVKAEEVDNPYIFNDANLTTAWKEISIVCAGAGGIGLSGQATPDSGVIPGASVNPSLPGSTTINMLPDHTGGGGSPTSLTQRSPFTPKASDTKKQQSGLRSDGELVQGKKGKKLLGHELSHTKQTKTKNKNATRHLNLSTSDHKKADSHDKLANLEKSHQKRSIPLKSSTTSSIRTEKINNTKQSKPTLYQGKAGDRCVEKRFPKNAVIKAKGKQSIAECIKGKVTIIRNKKVMRQWKKGDPIFP